MTEAAGHPRISVRVSIEDWLGPVTAVVRWRQSPALLRLLDWRGQGLQQRVYTVTSVDPDLIIGLERELDTGYCDLNRHKNVVDDLMRVSFQPDCWILCELPGLTITRCIPAAELPAPQYRDIEELLHDPSGSGGPLESDRWFSPFNEP